MEFTRAEINQKYYDLLNNDDDPLSKSQVIQVLKAIVDLNGLALPKSASPQALREMTREQLAAFIAEHESSMIDVSPTYTNSDPTPRGGAKQKVGNSELTPRKNFTKNVVPGGVTDWRIGDAVNEDEEEEDDWLGELE